MLLSPTGRMEFLLNFQRAFSSSNYVINVQFMSLVVVPAAITRTFPSGRMCANISDIFIL